jgi:hypothetical protein
MADLVAEIVEQIELHSPAGIRNCFERGLDPNTEFREKPLIYELTSEYTRSPRFKECVNVFVEYGLQFADEVLLAVWLDDANLLDHLLSQDARAVNRVYSLRCAYTPIHEASLMHICAEFNHVASATVLASHGADINAVAGKDVNGFGGQTPIFHTVNQNGNQSLDMFYYLLSCSADLEITVPGLIWGKGYPWETLIPAVNPISYAMMGLLPQFHRDEVIISNIVTILLEHRYGIDYEPANVPCAYLKK